MLDKKEQLLAAALAYNDIYKSISQKIDREIADSQLYNREQFDTISLLELKRSSSYANNLVGEIILLMSQELFLEENLEGFEKKYDQAIFSLGIQEENLKLQVKLQEETHYKNVSTQLTATYAQIETLTPELKDLFGESREISNNLEAYEQIISSRTESLIMIAESLRQKKNRLASRILVIGQAFFFFFLLVLFTLTGWIFNAAAPLMGA